jgi:serine/threonine protein kinase
MEQMYTVAGTQKGDVYSFGIILYELHARHGPFGEPGLTPPEILLRVIRSDPDQPPFRYTASFCVFILKKNYYYYYYYYYYLLQLSFHSVAVVLTLVQGKGIP